MTDQPLTARVACPGRILASDRTCLTCHWPVLEGRGVGYPHLRALAHSGLCVSAITRLERVCDRSTRGRWRPAKQVHAMADGSLCNACTAVAR